MSLKIWRPLRSLFTHGDPGYSSLTLLDFLSIALTRTLRIVLSRKPAS